LKSLCGELQKEILVAGKIFINYRRVEAFREARYLKALFANKFGPKRVFLDQSSIEGGSNWLHALVQEGAASDAMIVLIGKNWANIKDEQGRRRLDDPADPVREEISQGLSRRLTILPVLTDHATMPNNAQLPNNIMLLTQFQAMPLREQSFEEDAEAIAKRLKVLLRPRCTPTWQIGLGLSAAFAAGVALGPIALRLRVELAAAELRVTNAESALKAADARAESLSQTLLAVEKERDSLKERLPDRSAPTTPVKPGCGYLGSKGFTC
jgi:TIR domain